MIGVIAALPEEAAVIAGAMRESRVSRSAGVAVTCGIIGGREVVLAQSGVGKVNAALCAQALISVYAVDCVINTGVARELDKRLATDAHPAPAQKTIVQRFIRAILTRRIFPLQAMFDDINDAADDFSVIDPRNTM